MAQCRSDTAMIIYVFSRLKRDWLGNMFAVLTFFFTPSGYQGVRFALAKRWRHCRPLARFCDASVDMSNNNNTRVNRRMMTRLTETFRLSARYQNISSKRGKNGVTIHVGHSANSYKFTGALRNDSLDSVLTGARYKSLCSFELSF